MKINPVQLVDVAQLRTNPTNPKGPLGLKYKRGLRASLAKWGFAGVLIVAENADGTCEILDGNTRLEDLERAGVEKIPAIVFKDMGDDERKTFVLSHDRHRKMFNEDAVLAQLEELAGNAEDLKELALLSGKDNLERLLAESSTRGQAAAGEVQTGSAAPAMGSLVLYGPAADMAGIRLLLKSIKGRMSTMAKTHKALADADRFLDWTDEKVIVLLLSTIARLQNGDQDEKEGSGVRGQGSEEKPAAPTVPDDVIRPKSRKRRDSGRKARKAGV